MTAAHSHLGTKIEQERLRLGLLKRDLAAHFSMKPPSVTELLQTGRLTKDKYQRLVDLNGRSLDWWFDITPPAATSCAQPGTAAARTAPEAHHLAVVPTLQDKSPPYTTGPHTSAPASSPAPGAASELVELFSALPSAEQARLLEDLRTKAAFYRVALRELIDRQQSAPFR